MIFIVIVFSPRLGTHPAIYSVYLRQTTKIIRRFYRRLENNNNNKKVLNGGYIKVAACGSREVEASTKTIKIGPTSSTPSVTATSKK